MSDQSNPYTPPQSVLKNSRAMESELASRGVRLAASLVDGLIVLLVLGLLYGVTVMSSGVMESDDPEAELDSVILAMALGLGFLLPLCVNAYLLVTRGQSMAKLMFGIRIVRPDGSAASAMRILVLRWFLPMCVGGLPLVGGVFSIVDACMIFRETKRCLHDDWADTVVVKI